MQLHTRKAVAGFTMIELMIVVVIMALLAAIAIPNYLAYTLKGRRSDAMAGIANAQGVLERCYAATFDYSQVNTTTSQPTGCVAINAVSPNKYYTIALVVGASPASSYTVTAVPAVGSVQQKDTTCTEFLVTSANVETATPAANDTTCWSH